VAVRRFKTAKWRVQFALGYRGREQARADSRAAWIAGMSNAIIVAKIATTMSNSTKVKPRVLDIALP